MFVLATVCRPPGHHTDFIKEFDDFISELELAADKVLIVGDFNIHGDNEKDTLGSELYWGLDNTCQDLLIVEIIL